MKPTKKSEAWRSELMTFEDALKIILAFEGGYVNHPNDPGGETNFGISKRAYPNCDIKNLTTEQAGKIYKMDYWDKIQGDRIDPAIRLIVFDCAVNQGVVRAIKFLQKVTGVREDGVFGPITYRSLEDVTNSEFIDKYSQLRLKHYTSIGGWKDFGKGWAKRLLEVSVTSAFFVGVELIKS